MQENLEQYINKIFRKTKQFLRKNLPEDYEEPNIKLRTEYHPSKRLEDYSADYDYKSNKILFTFHKKEETIKDDDIVTNFLRVKMQRKNSYLVSMMHEIFEAQYINDLTKRKLPVSEYDFTMAHERAVKLELKALDKLINKSRDRDKEDFIRRKEARQKEFKAKIRGV